MNELKIIARIIAFPFILGIICISAIRLIIKKSYEFLRYGGEFIPYRKGEHIVDVYDKVCELIDKEEEK